MIKISVIIPVYNAASYVREAVESALAQPETAEVILIEDGSSDDSLTICTQLAQEHNRVRLLRHPNGKNRGAGLSRNLGITNARSEYVAFLDADDYYLPGRFSVAVRILTENPDVDGVYETIGMVYENQIAREEWQQRAPEVYERGLLGPKEAFPPEELLNAWVEKRGIFFSGNGLTVRRSALIRVGMYPSVAKAEDAMLCIKLAAKARMVAGRLDEPVATYRTYGTNRTSLWQAPEKEEQRRTHEMREALWEWGISNLPVEVEQKVFDDFMFWTHKLLPRGRWARKIALLRVLGSKLAAHPRLIRRAYFRRRILSEFIPGALRRLKRK